MDNPLVACGGAFMLAGLALWVLGPLGLVLSGFALLTVGLWSSSESGVAPAENCPDCGAVADGEECDYCGRSL